MFKLIFTSMISIFLCSQAIGAVKWNNSSSESKGETNEYSFPQITPKKGKLAEKNTIVKNCKGAKKSYEINFSGSTIFAGCQLPGAKKYEETGKLPASPNDNFWGYSLNRCTKNIKQPKDLYIYSISMDKFCPYDNPKVAEFNIRNDNGLIKFLKTAFPSAAEETGADVVTELEPLFFKGHNGPIPWKLGDEPFGEAEWNSYRKIKRKHSKIISLYLSPNNKDKEIAAKKALEFLEEYEKNEAFSYLYFSPITHAGGSKGRFDDFKEADFYDGALSRLNMILPSIIMLYGIVKEEYPSSNNFQIIEAYVERLVWLLNDSGLNGGRFGNIKIKKLKWSIDQLDHHTTWYAMIYSIWGVTRGDNKYYQAGLNQFIAALDASRQDGSIISEVKQNPRPKSTHGGWGSLVRNNESLSYLAVAAAALSTQEPDLMKFNVNGVSFKNLLDFGVLSSVDNSIADKHTKVKEYEKKHIDDPGSALGRNLSWYNLMRAFVEYPENAEFEKLLQNSDNNLRLEELGILSTQK